MKETKILRNYPVSLKFLRIFFLENYDFFLQLHKL